MEDQLEIVNGELERGRSELHQVKYNPIPVAQKESSVSLRERLKLIELSNSLQAELKRVQLKLSENERPMQDKSIQTGTIIQ